MPCFGTTDRTMKNACTLTEKLGASLQEIPIHEAVNLHFRDIGHDPEVHDVTYENSQARQRTLILMNIANQANGMVIGTGDMSELALGWATYNGDHMSMYGVNCSIPKCWYAISFYITPRPPMTKNSVPCCLIFWILRSARSFSLQRMEKSHKNRGSGRSIRAA